MDRKPEQCYGGYSTLGCYNPHGKAHFMPGQTSGVFITPEYGAIGYDALTHGNRGCGGYFKIDDAYHTNSGKCDTIYSRRYCGGCTGCKEPVGSGHRWACDQEKKTCEKVHPGTFHEGGTFRSKYECMKGGCPYKV